MVVVVVNGGTPWGDGGRDGSVAAEPIDRKTGTGDRESIGGFNRYSYP